MRKTSLEPRKLDILPVNYGSGGTFLDCRSRATAWRWAPWASSITKVDGGFLAFRLETDFQTWKAQK